MRVESLEGAPVARQVGELRGSPTPIVSHFIKNQWHGYTQFQKYAYPEHTTIVIVDALVLFGETGMKRSWLGDVSSESSGSSSSSGGTLDSPPSSSMKVWCTRAHACFVAQVRTCVLFQTLEIFGA